MNRGMKLVLMCQDSKNNSIANQENEDILWRNDKEVEVSERQNLGILKERNNEHFAMDNDLQLSVPPQTSSSRTNTVMQIDNQIYVVQPLDNVTIFLPNESDVIESESLQNRFKNSDYYEMVEVPETPVTKPNEIQELNNEMVGSPQEPVNKSNEVQEDNDELVRSHEVPVVAISNAIQAYNDVMIGSQEVPIPICNVIQEDNDEIVGSSKMPSTINELNEMQETHDQMTESPEMPVATSESNEMQEISDKFIANRNKRSESKCNRMRGKAYTGYSRVNNVFKFGPPRSKREISDICRSKFCQKSSKRHCGTFTQEQRSRLFNKFWKLSWDEKKVYVASLVTREDKKVSTVSSSEQRRLATYRYYLINHGDRKLEVCKTMFLGTLGLKEWMVHNWIKTSLDGLPNEKTKTHKSTPKDRRYEAMKNWLSLIPRLPSHYCRKSSNKVYLEGDFTCKNDFYNVYTKWCIQEDTIPLSRTTFFKLVKKENISIFKPRKDQCDICVGYRNKQIFEEYYKSHIKCKELSRKEKDTDVTEALEKKKHVITVDLMAVQLCPKMEASALYYSQKLKVHNFTFFDVGTKEAACYWWDESEGELVASVFTSIMIKHLTNNYITTPQLPIVIWSDGCGYQNRNNILANALLHFSKVNNVQIEQKFLTKGHTQMECDSIHRVIERKLLHREIHLPSDYYKISKEARKKPKPYTVHMLDHSYFLDYTQQSYFVYDSIRPGKSTNDPEVKDIRSLRYNATNDIEFKLQFCNDYKILPNRKRCIQKISAPIYRPLYNNSLKISFTKWCSLQKLKAVLPSDTHFYYDNLAHESELKDRKKLRI